MIHTRLATAALVAAAVVAMASPSYAQRRGNGNRGSHEQHAQAQRGGRPAPAQARQAQPQVREARPQARGSHGSEWRQQAQQAQPRGNFGPQDHGNARGHGWGQSQPQAQPRGNYRQVAPPRSTYQAPARPRGSYQQVQPRGSWQQVQPRGSWQQAQPRGGYAGRQYNSPPQRDRGYSDRHDDQRRYAAPRSYAPSYGYRGGSTYGYHGGYGAYRSYGHRSYAIPYGYRRHGRSGWSFNLYFGRPYGYYDGDAAYGYYAIAPGFAYGSVRIVDAPPDAQVFVDGYYAGVVDDYDGVFQHLNLVPGSHRIEIGVPGYAPIGVDVFIEPGQMITYRANMY